MTKKLLNFMLVLIIGITCLSVLAGCGKQNTNQDEVSKEVYEQPLRSYMEGLKNRNLDQLLQAYPEFMHMENLITQANIDGVYAQYEAIYGSNIVFDYSLGEATKVYDDDLESLSAQLRELYPDAGDIKIDKAFIITIELKITGDGIKQEGSEENSAEENQDSEESKSTKTDTQDFYVYRYNNNWYMY